MYIKATAYVILALTCGSLKSAPVDQNDGPCMLSMKWRTCRSRKDPSGRCYLGSINKSSKKASALPCMKWSSILLKAPWIKKPVQRDHNNCRNPSNDERGPYCYIKPGLLSRTRKEYCDIPRCSVVRRQVRKQMKSIKFAPKPPAPDSFCGNHDSIEANEKMLKSLSVPEADAPSQFSARNQFQTSNITWSYYDLDPVDEKSIKELSMEAKKEIAKKICTSVEKYLNICDMLFFDRDNLKTLMSKGQLTVLSPHKYCDYEEKLTDEASANRYLIEFMNHHLYFINIMLHDEIARIISHISGGHCDDLSKCPAILMTNEVENTETPLIKIKGVDSAHKLIDGATCSQSPIMGETLAHAFFPSSNKMNGRGQVHILKAAFPPLKELDILLAKCALSIDNCKTAVFKPFELKDQFTIQYEDYNKFRWITIHEFLHATGLPHSHDTRSVMYSTTKNIPDILESNRWFGGPFGIGGYTRISGHAMPYMDENVKSKLGTRYNYAEEPLDMDAKKESNVGRSAFLDKVGHFIADSGGKVFKALNLAYDSDSKKTQKKERSCRRGTTVDYKAGKGAEWDMKEESIDGTGVVMASFRPVTLHGMQFWDFNNWMCHLGLGYFRELCKLATPERLVT